MFALALAAAIAFAPALAEARANTGGSSGSRGSRTFSQPSATPTAPSAGQPMQRTQAQPGQPGAATNRPATPAAGGFFGSALGKGLMGGLLGAGLMGLLMGGGLTGGLGSIMSILGLVLQIGIIFLLVRLAMNWFASRRQQQPAMAGAGAQRSSFGGLQGGSGLGGLAGGAAAGGLAGGAAAPPPAGPLEVQGEDYAAFERLLADVQNAYAEENLTRLRTLTTDEMATYFADDIAEMVRKGQASRISGVKLVQGDLSEAWREAGEDYATVAMKFSIVDTTVDRVTGKIISGDTSEPAEVTEIWTFVRPTGTKPRDWKLSAIQQA